MTAVGQSCRSCLAHRHRVSPEDRDKEARPVLNRSPDQRPAARKVEGQ